VSKPATLAIKDLSRAVQEAAARHNIPAQPGIHFGPIIMGIILRPPAPEIRTAEEAAANIASHVGTTSAAALGGAQLEPAVLVRPGGPIICGFIAPESLALE
jgi:hypothetical protein